MRAKLPLSLLSALAVSMTITSCNHQEQVVPMETGSSLHHRLSNSEPTHLVALNIKFSGPETERYIEEFIRKYRISDLKYKVISGKAFVGFSATFTEEEIKRIKGDKEILSVELNHVLAFPDIEKSSSTNIALLDDPIRSSPGKDIPMLEPITFTSEEPALPFVKYTITPLPGQTISWGATKVGVGDGAATGRTAWIIDSGIQLNHPDLNVDVTRSQSFLSTTTSADDEFGHGTQVAGI